MSLSRIIGVVKDLKITGVIYEDVVFNANHRTVGGVAATGAVLLGEVASSAILSTTVASGAEIPMTGFMCSVNGMSVRGAFYEIGFSEGETVEFVGEEAEGNFISVAARSESQKLIWTIPYHGCGHVAHRRSVRKWGFILSVFGAFAATVINVIIFRLNPEVPLIFHIFPPVVAFFSVMLINYWARSHFTQFSKNATLIFETFGFSKPEEVDLQAAHALADEEFRIINKDATQMSTPWSYRF